MTQQKKPIIEANRISTMLNTVLGVNRFPVAVDELALEYSRKCFPDEPIDKVKGDALDGFEGMLYSNPKRTRWLILYNDATRSEGRKRFTVAHEFGHYILHRQQQELFECGENDIETDGSSGGDIEAEADVFASTLLMPLDDFRRQVDGHPVSFDLLSHCADRYTVSLTAAALRWVEIADKRVVLIASRDDHMLWAKSNGAALKSRAYFPTRKKTFELPQNALAHGDNGIVTSAQTRTSAAKVWFAHEPPSMELTEMAIGAGQYDYTLTLLLMPDAEWQGWSNEENEERDTFDHISAT